jgi:hypothetical protein
MEPSIGQRYRYVKMMQTTSWPLKLKNWAKKLDRIVFANLGEQKAASPSAITQYIVVLFP